MGDGDGGAGALPAGPDVRGELRQRVEPGRHGLLGGHLCVWPGPCCFPGWRQSLALVEDISGRGNLSKVGKGLSLR